jgi:two-component system, NtrC family, nitrogen regulation response regulator NtrX
MTMTSSILVVDDEPGILTTLSSVLGDEGYSVITAKDGETALKRIKETLPSLVLLDIWMPGMDGIETLKRIKATSPHLLVIIMSGHGSIETAVKATKLGAFDYIEKPLSLEKVTLLIRHALRQQQLEAENLSLKQTMKQSFTLIGESPPIRKLKDLVKIAGSSSSRILISGENGTGKELVAREIHGYSDRRDQPFIEINCAAIPDPLFESELFGHEKGAFTGADSAKLGRFEQANGATLFLDEIGDMSLTTQAKVLRVLQEQRFYRVGGTRAIEVDVRVIAASNKDLPVEIAMGQFREDLYYRLNVIPLHVPPLRERSEDIPLLTAHFVKDVSTAQTIEPKELDPGAMRALMEYTWPGNVRELRNLIERLMIMFLGKIITREDVLSLLGDRTGSGESRLDGFESSNLKEARAAFEREFIHRKLRENGWNVTRAAEALQIERTYLYRKIKALGIEIPPES